MRCKNYEKIVIIIFSKSIQTQSKKMDFSKTLEQHMKNALDNYFVHLKFETFSDEDDDETLVMYSPPFYFEDDCRNSTFGIVTKSKSYPLTCTSEDVDYEFIIQSPEDWINHIEEFVCWTKEYKKIIAHIRS